MCFSVVLLVGGDSGDLFGFFFCLHLATTIQIKDTQTKDRHSKDKDTAKTNTAKTETQQRPTQQRQRDSKKSNEVNTKATDKQQSTK